MTVNVHIYVLFQQQYNYTSFYMEKKGDLTIINKTFKTSVTTNMRFILCIVSTANNYTSFYIEKNGDLTIINKI